MTSGSMTEATLDFRGDGSTAREPFDLGVLKRALEKAGPIASTHD